MGEAVRLEVGDAIPDVGLHPAGVVVVLEAFGPAADHVVVVVGHGFGFQVDEFE